MNAITEPGIGEPSALFAAFSAAFRYPGDGRGWLSGPEFLAAFDPGASEGAVSLNEGAYANIDISSVFEELVRFYEHFGLRRHEKAELPDHLSVELEFMHFLCELEVAASSNGDANREALRSLHAAQRDFLDRHLLRLLRGVREKRGGMDDGATLLVRECLDFSEAFRAALPA
jgi:DMSO reductase family type II enzyme chaperone